MRKSSVLYIIGVISGIFSLFEVLSVLTFLTPPEALIILLSAVSILWTGVFVEGWEDGQVGFDAE